MHSELNSLLQYYSDNKININVNKCECITFTRKPNPVIYSYNFNGAPIRRTSLIRDLGVYLDSKMTFSDHIDRIIDQSFKNLGFVIRSCKPFKNLSTLNILYKLMIAVYLNMRARFGPHNMLSTRIVWNAYKKYLLNI